MRYALLTFFTLLFFASNQNAQDKPVSNSVPIEADQNYLVLSTKKIQTMEKELDEVAAKGFRVLYGAPTQQVDMAILLTRPTDSNQLPYSYKILATSRLKTMEKELNEAASQGYRLLPRTIIFKTGFITAELLMLLEREPEATKVYEYKLIAANKEAKLHKLINESATLGFSPVTMITLGGHVIVLEKESLAPVKAAPTP